MTNWINRNRWPLLSGLILAIALLLRLYNLGGTSLWLDEAVYANNSHAGFADFLANTRGHNSSPILLPLLYWVLGEAVRTPFLIRLPPALFSLLAVAVVLRLPKAGVSTWVAGLSALWLALAPVQVLYAQEVREYSLGVLLSALLVYGFLLGLEQLPSRKMPWLLLAALGLAPLASYGNIFLAGVLLGLFLLSAARQRSLRPGVVLALVATFLLANLACYLLTARYQMAVGGADYLASAYPPQAATAVLAWLLRANAGYFGFLLGGKLPALVSGLLLAVGGVAYWRRQALATPDGRLLLILLALLPVLNLLALLHLYPFGGIRQQLFSSPVVVLAVIAACRALLTPDRLRLPGAVAFVALLILPTTLSGLDAVYRDGEDILSPVAALAPTLPDGQVYVYYGAVPAVTFHFPDRRFAFPAAGRGEVAAMSREIAALPGEDVGLVFSHVYRNEDGALLTLLVQNGYRIREDRRFVRSRLVILRRTEAPGRGEPAGLPPRE